MLVVVFYRGDGDGGGRMLHQQWEMEAGGVSVVAAYYREGGREGGREEGDEAVGCGLSASFGLSTCRGYFVGFSPPEGCGLRVGCGLCVGYLGYEVWAVACMCALGCVWALWVVSSPTNILISSNAN